MNYDGAQSTKPQRQPLTHPLGEAFLLDGEPISGRIKKVPDDFIVEEIPLYEPSGEGEHRYLRVQKFNMSHGEMLHHLSQCYGVAERSIGFAGMKDRRAVTTQTVSLQSDRPTPSDGCIHDRLRVQWEDRHSNKLRRGHLAGNRFVIRIREIDPLQAPEIYRRLLRVEQSGVPNYFGPQRFGYRANGQILGAAVIRADWQGVLDELLGTGGSGFPDHQSEWRTLYEAGEFRNAMEACAAGDRSERAALKALADGATPEKACRAIGRAIMGFWVNALQSAMFNRLLDERIHLGWFHALHPGDVAWKHDSRASFIVRDDEADLDERLARFEISPSGPMWAEDMLQAEGRVRTMEEAVLASAGLTRSDLENAPLVVAGARRPYRARVIDPDVESGTDESGGYVRVVFELLRGEYATVVLREVLHLEHDDDGVI